MLLGVTWSVTWALPGLLFWDAFLGWGPKIPASLNQTFEKIIFHLEMLPGPAPQVVLVTWLPGPPSEINFLFILGLLFSEPNSAPKPTQIPTANTESTFLSLEYDL